MRTEPSDKTATISELQEIMAFCRRLVGMFQSSDDVSSTIKSGLNIALATWSIACPKEGIVTGFMRRDGSPAGGIHIASPEDAKRLMVTNMNNTNPKLSYLATGTITRGEVYAEVKDEKQSRVMTATIGPKTRPKASPNPGEPPAPPPPPPTPPAPPKLRSRDVPPEPVRKKKTIPATLRGRRTKPPSDFLFGEDED